MTIISKYSKAMKDKCDSQCLFHTQCPALEMTLIPSLQLWGSQDHGQGMQDHSQVYKKPKKLGEDYEAEERLISPLMYLWRAANTYFTFCIKVTLRLMQRAAHPIGSNHALSKFYIIAADTQGIALDLLVKLPFSCGGNLTVVKLSAVAL
ncbi:hypothetical protein BDR06DRAFT_971891 [Suillus hirtellus]|nr:hypothetical protein BDR06DRAFT_971891 [Suillus hirtellus]